MTKMTLADPIRLVRTCPSKKVPPGAAAVVSRFQLGAALATQGTVRFLCRTWYHI